MGIKGTVKLREKLWRLAINLLNSLMLSPSAIYIQCKQCICITINVYVCKIADADLKKSSSSEQCTTSEDVTNQKKKSSQEQGNSEVRSHAEE